MLLRALALVLLLAALRPAPSAAQAGGHVLTVRGEQLLLDGRPFQVKGLRCSNALRSDADAAELVAHLDTLAAFGVNTVSVYFMGSRFGDVKGYRPDGSIDPVYGARMARIIRAADARGMVVLVGVLYWGTSDARYENWTQTQADAAVAATVRWLKTHAFRNVFVDVDNEGMAERAMGFDPEAMIRAGKAVDPSFVLGYNSRREALVPGADVHLHFAPPVAGKPYVESEGTVAAGTGGGYWGAYSKRPGLYNYVNVGVYNDAYKEAQKRATAEHLRRGHGYMLASTWLQAVPPKGPNHRPGGVGTEADPGIRWWLEYLRDHHGGPYEAP